MARTKANEKVTKKNLRDTTMYPAGRKAREMTTMELEYEAQKSRRDSENKRLWGDTEGKK